MRYSHTKLDVARQCMQKFKFQYIDKIQVEDDDREAADFGVIVHEIAEKYTGGGKEQLLALYHEIVPSKLPMPEKYRHKIPLALKNIHSYWESVLSRVEKVEHELDTTIQIDEEISLNGKIDLIIYQENGKIKIGDYKTNKSKEYANHTSQLAMYMLILNKKFGIPYENMDCEIIYLALDEQNKKGQPVLNEGYENISKVYKLEESDVECLISEISMINSRIKKSIDKGEWKANPTKFNCTYCKFEKLCDKSYLKVNTAKGSHEFPDCNS